MAARGADRKEPEDLESERAAVDVDASLARARTVATDIAEGVEEERLSEPDLVYTSVSVCQLNTSPRNFRV